MDALDLFLKQVNYKFPKGHCDINDAQDVALLQFLLEQHGVSEIEGPGTRLSCVSYCDTRMANVK